MDRKPGGIGDLGPKWITAIASLIVALTGAGIFVGRATAPTTAPPVTVNQPGSSARQPGSTVDRSKSPVGTGEGTVLATYSVDVSESYGIALGAERPHPVQVGLSCSDADLINRIFGAGLCSSGQLAILDAPTMSYTACKNDTRYTTSYVTPEPGLVVCFTGHGVIAGVKITDPNVVSLDVTVWKGP